MNEQSEHLSNAQIENYGNRSSGAGPDADQHDEARINAHLADCPSCRSHLLDFHRTNFGLLADSKQLVDLRVNTASTPDCPSEDDLRQLAAGLSPQAINTKLTRHAATCNRCAQLLRIYTEIYSDDFSVEEQAVLEQLKSASPEWQQQTARTMLRASAASNASSVSETSNVSVTNSSFAAKLRRFFSTKWMLIPATAAACAIAFSVWYVQRDTPEKVEKLLAQAYTDNRNIEIRIPGAKHSDFHQKRGEVGSLISSPKTLRKAANEIGDQLKQNPDSPKWLLLQVRLDLLDWRYKPAIATLNKITDDKIVNSPDGLMARAMTAYEQAESEHEQQGYFEAIDLLGKILQKNPNEAVALFNRAIICEKQHAFECASGDWKHLLEVEEDPGWSSEAREHLNRIEEKKKLAH
ncbi:MAG: hypothetical protein LAO78_24070 [Acidobacteriia bacterium]|nr:hypothetical protein [Terriglobia bacterium]